MSHENRSRVTVELGAVSIVPCSEYDSATNACRSGHIRLHPICRGVVPMKPACTHCGRSENVPMCMLEDQPPHLIRDDGYPLGWPAELAEHRQKFEGK